MDINELTLGQIKEVAALKVCQSSATPPAFNAYPVGCKVLVRTVTYHYIGELVLVTAGELVLKDCAWLANSGRFANALKTGVVSEAEPYPDGEVVLNRGAVIDCCLWNHDLIRAVVE